MLLLLTHFFIINVTSDFKSICLWDGGLVVESQLETSSCKYEVVDSSLDMLHYYSGVPTSCMTGFK